MLLTYLIVSNQYIQGATINSTDAAYAQANSSCHVVQLMPMKLDGGARYSRYRFFLVIYARSET